MRISCIKDCGGGRGGRVIDGYLILGFWVTLHICISFSGKIYVNQEAIVVSTETGAQCNCNKTGHSQRLLLLKVDKLKVRIEG